MLTSFLVALAVDAATLGVVVLLSDGKDHSDGKVANNPFSEWESNQPYNP